MKVYTLLVLNANDEVIQEESFDYEGPVALCKGPSIEERAAQAQQAEFSKFIMGEANKTFANQQKVLDSITAAWNPVLAAGPGQFGFTPEQTSAMRSQATEGTAAEFAKAKAAVNGELAARGGGDIPIAALSGTNAQIASTIDSAAAESQASKQLGITRAGYDLGYNKYLAATQALSGAAGMQNPIGYLSPGNQANANSFNMADTISKEQNAASPWNFIAPILGGAIGTGLNIITGGAASGLTSSLGGILGGGGAGTITNGGGFGQGGDWGVCWIAAELYGGWDNPRTQLMRNWLLNEYSSHPVGNLLVKMYKKYGLKMASVISRSKTLRWMFKKLFDAGLKRAEVWNGTIND